MCQTIHNCIGNSAKCPHIKIMDSLTNPSKNKIGGTLSFAAKLIHLEPGRQQALNQLVLDIISSSSQSVHLIITHGDIIRHLLFFIENLFANEAKILDGFFQEHFALPCRLRTSECCIGFCGSLVTCGSQFSGLKSKRHAMKAFCTRGQNFEL